MAASYSTVASNFSCCSGSTGSEAPGNPPPAQPEVGKDEAGPSQPLTRVSLFFTPLNNPAGSLTGWPLTILASPFTSGLRGDARSLMHWAVGFEFPGEAGILICEATREQQTGELVANSTWRTAAAVEATRPRRVVLGHYPVSEDNVQGVLKESLHLGPYDVCKNSCQTFVIHLLHQLGIEVPNDVLTAEQAIAQSSGISSTQ